MDRLLESMEYANYINNMANMDAKFDAFIQECILISEGKNTVANMEVVTEGLIDKGKRALNKILEVFSRLWGKFTETLNRLFRSNKGYLQHYKDIILKKPAVDQEWSMYDWQKGQKVLLATSLPDFNFAAVKQYLEDTATFCNHYFPQIMSGQKEGVKLGDACRFKFRGDLTEEKTIKESSLNMTDMYNFCIKYDTMLEYMKKDIAIITKAATECQTKLEQIGREEAKPTPSNTNSTQESVRLGNINKAFNETFGEFFGDPKQYYSFVYESYVNEISKVDDNKNKDDNNSQPNPPGAGGERETDPAKAMTRNDASKNTSEVKDGDTTKDEASIWSEKVNNIYLTCCTAVSCAKMECLESMYKDYMTIIRNKVKFYVGKKDEKKQNPDVATNQKVGNNSNGSSENDKQVDKDIDKKNRGILDIFKSFNFNDNSNKYVKPV